MENKKLILCIDDDQDILDSLRLILEANNYRVSEASNTDEGVEKFEFENPDMVIVDLMMDQIDGGLKIVDSIRNKNTDVPVFLLSGVGNDFHNNCDSSAEGFSGVLQKPVTPETLLEVVNHRLGN